MGYTKKTCRINDKIETEKYYVGNNGAPGLPREEKRKKTPEDMERQNFWRRCQYLRRTIELNYKGGDMLLTLTCRPEDRPSPEEAGKVIRGFRDRVAKEYKKQGWIFKYIITCEVGSRGAVHWHMILNNESNGEISSWDIVRKHWTLGRPHMTPLDAGRDYKQLAEYLVKAARKRMDEGGTLEKLSYIASRNLKRPVERKCRVSARKWKKDPVAPKGYTVIPESIINGINKFTGLPFQKYTVIRIGSGGRRKDGG